MTLTQAQWDPRATTIRFLGLCNISAASGEFGFILGTDGVFKDVNGKTWYGSTLLELPKMKSAINGIAPAGEISMNFFQDPNTPDLITQLQANGVAEVSGRKISFYMQPLASAAEISAPVLPPELLHTRVMRSLSFSGSGVRNRRITLGFESWAEDRRSARRIALNTQGHEQLTGAANPSLTYMPTENFEEQRLFG